MIRARNSHRPSAAAADPLALTGRTPSRRFDVVTTTPAASFSPCAPSPRRLDALATNAGEKRGLATDATGPGGSYGTRKRILVVEDSFAVAGLVRYALEQNGGADVDVVGTASALECVREDPPELIVIDLPLPNEAGLDLCGRLRASVAGAEVPIIMTAPQLTESDRVLALDLGADDCLTRPFGVHEFAARVRALARRRTSRSDRPGIYRGAGLVADFARVAVVADGKAVDLTRREFLLLQELIANRDRVLSRGQLIERVWPDDQAVMQRTVDVHVGRMRAKLGSVSARIETVFGIGYRFVHQQP